MTDFIAPAADRIQSPPPPPAGGGGFVAPQSDRIGTPSAQPRLVPLENNSADPVWMQGRPGYTPSGNTAPSRDIPEVTATQLAARTPEANLGDWLRYLSGASFVMDTVPGLVPGEGGEAARARSQDLISRINATLSGANAQPGVGELMGGAGTPTTRLENGNIASPLNGEWWRDEGRSWANALNFAFDANEGNRIAVIRHQYPEAQFRRDERGYLQVRRTSDDDWNYLNRPGASVTDLTDFGGNLVKYLPAARLAGGARTFSGRMLTSALASGGTEYLSQEALRLVGGEGAQADDVLMSTAAGGAGQGAFDAALGASPALVRAFRSSLGMPEPAIRLPDPTPPAPAPAARAQPPAGRPDPATRSTPEEIAALEDELEALRRRGPTGVRDPGDTQRIRSHTNAMETSPEARMADTIAQLEARIRSARSNSEANRLRQQINQIRAEGPQPGPENLSVPEGNVVSQQAARQRWGDDIVDLERRIAEARQPYFADGPADIPANSNISDGPFDNLFQALRTQRPPADAGDALTVRLEERLARQVLPGGASGEPIGISADAIRAAPAGELEAAKNALDMAERVAASVRAGTATYRQIQQVRNGLRHFENTATGADQRAVRRVLFAFDEWLDLAFSTHRTALRDLAPNFDAATLSLNQRTASLSAADRPVAPQTPIHTAAPTPSKPPPPPTRQQVRAAFDEQRIPASRGQVTQDVRARQREDDLIQSGEQRALDFANEQAAAVEGRMNDLATRGAPRLTQTVDDAGEALAEDVQRRFQQLDDLADDTYSRAFELLGGQRVSSDAGESLINNVRTRIERGPGSTDDPMFQYEDTGRRFDDILESSQSTYPAAREALKIVTRLQRDIEEGALNFAVVARRRQAINAAASAARGQDAYVMRDIRHGFDEWLNTQLGRQQTARIFTGEEAQRQAAEASLRAEAHALYTEANAIWRERAQLFGRQTGRRDPGGAVLERIRDQSSGLTGTQVINTIFNPRLTPTQAAVGALRRIRAQAMGTQASGRVAPSGEATSAQTAFDEGGLLTPPMQILREAFWQRIGAPLLKRRPNTLVPARALAENLDRAINGEGAAITRMLHTGAEIEQMQNLLQVLKYIERPIGVNTSGTAITARRMLGTAMDSLVSSIPRSVAFVPRLFGLLTGRSIDDLMRAAESSRRFSRPALDVDFGRSESGTAFGQAVLNPGDRQERGSVDPNKPQEMPAAAERPPTEDPRAGLTNLGSYAAGTITFHDGSQWVTLPTILGGEQIGVQGAIQLWRDGVIEPLSTSVDEETARAAAQSHRAVNATN